MPNYISKDMSRVAMAVNLVGEIVFAAITIPKQSNAIEVCSLTFGNVYTAIADKNNAVSQYAAIIKNGNVTDDTTALPSSPLLQNIGGEIIWFGCLQGVDGNQHIDFGDKPLVLPGGDSYVVYCCAPLVNTGATATMYPFISINASALDLVNRNIDWRMQ